jgi:hypothetical protein
MIPAIARQALNNRRKRQAARMIQPEASDSRSRATASSRCYSLCW